MAPGQMLIPKVCHTRSEDMSHIFRTGRPTNFKHGTLMEREDPYHRQAPLPPRSKVKVTRQINARIADAMWLM